MKKSFDTVKNINKLSGLFLPRGVFLIIQYAKDKGCFMTGPEDMEINNLNVLKEEVK